MRRHRAPFPPPDLEVLAVPRSSTRVGHIEAALETAGLHRKPGTPARSVRVRGSVRLHEVDGGAGRRGRGGIALRLAELMQEVATRHDGVVVRMLGDGAHFHFPDPSSAVAAPLELVEKAEPQGLPPAHVGVNAGPMTYIDGDYYGLTVILAARIASQAGPGQVLDGEAAAGNGTPQGIRFEAVGPVPLKGVARPVTVYQAVRDEFSAALQS